MIGYIITVCVGQSTGTWPMWGGEPSHKSVQLMKGAITTPVIKWFYATGAGVISQFSAIADVDGDGRTEVIIGSYDDQVHCIRGSNGTRKWSFSATAGISSSPAVADVDGDGHMEVVVGAVATDYRVYCLRGSDGTQKWAFGTNGSIISSPAVADVDGDGHMEVVVGSLDGRVYCLRGSDGTQKWAFSTGTQVRSSPAVADVDGDGMMEVVIGSGNGRVYCLRGSDGTQKWLAPTGGVVYSSPAVADVDGDGHMEIVVGSGDYNVYCLAGTNGGQDWIFSTSGQVLSSPAIADVDRDGQIEIIISAEPGNIYCLRGSDGTQKWRRTLLGFTRQPGPIVDINGDGWFEFLVSQVGTGMDSLFCINAVNGNVLWTIQLARDIHSPFAGDIDDDSCVEIIVGTGYADPQGFRLFAIDDPNGASGCGITDVDERGHSIDFVFKTTGSNLYLFIPQSTQVSLTLYDAQGRLVHRLYDGVLGQGGHTFNPNLENRGVYLAVLKYQGGMKSLKIVR